MLLNDFIIVLIFLDAILLILKLSNHLNFAHFGKIDCLIKDTLNIRVFGSKLKMEVVNQYILPIYYKYFTKIFLVPYKNKFFKNFVCLKTKKLRGVMAAPEEEIKDAKEEAVAKKYPRVRGNEQAKGKLRRGSMNSATSEMMAKYVSSLTNEQRAELTKKSMDLRNEHIVKRLEMKLEEATEQRNQATDIIKNLTKENEDLKFEMEEMRQLVQMKENDLKALEKDYNMINEMFEEEKLKYEMEMQKMDKLQMEMVEKEEQLELRAKEQELYETQKTQEISTTPQTGKQFDGYEEGESMLLSSPNEKRTHMQLQEEKARVQQLKQQMEMLMAKMDELSRWEEEYNRLEVEFNQLKDYCNKLEEENSEDIEEVNEVTTSVQNEIIKLAQRNARLEQEKQDLLKDLDNKVYEISMLQKSLELVQKANTAADVAAVAAVAAAVHSAEKPEEEITATIHIADEIDEDTQQSELLYSLEPEEFQYIEHSLLPPFHSHPDLPSNIDPILNSVPNDNVNNTTNLTNSTPKIITPRLPNLGDTQHITDSAPSESHAHEHAHAAEGNVKKLAQLQVPDVLKEYLHLTATAVKIKYPNVQIESDELMKKVQFEPYFNYYERMTQIMQAEEAKIRKAKRPPTPTQRKSFLAKMKYKIFGPSTASCYVFF
ncbi:erythrocyte binding protein, partial [Reticulomyxa filosa]